jgi:hypothetical protein
MIIDMCESCYYAEIEIKEGISKYPSIHKTKFLFKFCNKKYSVIQKFVSLEKSYECGYIPKSGQIGKKIYQKNLREY